MTQTAAACLVRTVGDVELGAGPGRRLGDPQVAVLLLAGLEEQDAGAALQVRDLAGQNRESAVQTSL